MSRNKVNGVRSKAAPNDNLFGKCSKHKKYFGQDIIEGFFVHDYPSSLPQPKYEVPGAFQEDIPPAPDL